MSSKPRMLSTQITSHFQISSLCYEVVSVKRKQTPKMTAIFRIGWLWFVWVRGWRFVCVFGILRPGQRHHMLLMAAVNPLNDPDDFIDERQRLTLTYAATMAADDEDASFPLRGLDFSPKSGSILLQSPPPPTSIPRQLSSPPVQWSVLRPLLLEGSFILGMFVSC